MRGVIRVNVVSFHLRNIAVCMSLLIISLPVCIASSLSYDGNGNLVTGDGYYRVYDSFNQLWKVYEGSDTTGNLLYEFDYHPLEERVLVKKVYTNGVLNKTIYYINENLVITEYANGTTVDTVYVIQDGVRVAEIENGVTKYLHPDYSGSTALITDEEGNVIENTAYTPYGEIVEGGTESRYGYEGKEHIQNGEIPPGKEAYFSFEGNPNDNNYNGTVYGATLTSGKFGQGYSFDGIDDYIDYGTQFDIDSQDSFTYAAWVYADNDLTERGVIFGGDYDSRDLFSLESDGKIKLRLGSSPLTSDGSINFGEWNHVVAVYTYDSGNGGMDSTVALYMNGELDKEDSPVWFRGLFNSWTTGQRRIGYDGDQDYLKGKIDDLGIWKRALSSDEVSDLYRHGAEGFGIDFDSRMQGIDGTPIFQQPDTLIPEVYNPQSLNRYAFEENNPYRYTDPTGHLPQSQAEGLIEEHIFSKLAKRKQERIDLAKEQLNKQLFEEYVESMGGMEEIKRTDYGGLGREIPSPAELQRRHLKKYFEVVLDKEDKVEELMYKGEKVTKSQMEEKGFEPYLVKQEIKSQQKSQKRERTRAKLSKFWSNLKKRITSWYKTITKSKTTTKKGSKK